MERLGGNETFRMRKDGFATDGGREAEGGNGRGDREINGKERRGVKRVLKVGREKE